MLSQTTTVLDTTKEGGYVSLMEKEAVVNFRISTEMDLIIRTLADARGITLSQAYRQIIVKGLPYWQGTSEGRRASVRAYNARKRRSINSLRAGDIILLPDGLKGILKSPGYNGSWIFEYVVPIEGIAEGTIKKSMIRIPPETSEE